MLHDHSLIRCSNRMAGLVVCRVIRKVLHSIILERLQDIGLRHSSEDGDLLRAEGDDRNWVRGTDMAAEGVLVRDVGGDLQSGDGEAG